MSREIYEDVLSKGVVFEVVAGGMRGKGIESVFALSPTIALYGYCFRIRIPLVPKARPSTKEDVFAKERGG